MRRARGIPRLTRPALALLAAVSLLASLVLGGHRYFYCPEMHAMSLHPCCSRTAGDAQDDGSGASPAIDDADCCTADRLAPAAPGTSAAAPPALRAPLVALLSPVVSIAAPPAIPAEIRARDARAGPGDPSPHAQRLRLMVFLT